MDIRRDDLSFKGDEMMRIHIALAADEKFTCGLIVTAGSMAMHASRDAELVFHILDGGIEAATFKRIVAMVTKWHPHCEFVRHPVDESVFSDFPIWGANRMTYARFLIPRFLPDEDYCIYCDVDFVWLADVGELWSKRNQADLFWSACETCNETLDKEERWFAARSLSFGRDKYFCAGLSFYNLKKMRQEGIFESMVSFMTAHPDVQMVDQTAANAVLYSRAVLLDSRWQRITISRTEGELVKDKVLHLAGECPWKRRFWTEMLTDTILLWHRMNGKIHGKTTFWSLRQYFPLRQIIARRALWYVVRVWGVRSVFGLLLRMMNRGVYIPEFAKWSHGAVWRGV